MELNREEVIKACEICFDTTIESCKGCPFLNNCKQDSLKKLALILIKELAEENATYEDNELNYIRQISRLQAKLESVKAKTANEILEQAKKYVHAFSDGTNIEEYVHMDDIKQIVKEVLEENK